MDALLGDNPTHMAIANTQVIVERLHKQGYQIVRALPKLPGEGVPFTFTYRNWRGEVSERSAIPKSVRYGSTEWHPEPQWLLLAYDLDKAADRDFALRDILPSTPTNAEATREIDHGYSKPQTAFASNLEKALRAAMLYTHEQNDSGGWRAFALFALGDGRENATTPANGEAREEAFNLAAHLQRQREWSRKTFGSGARTQGVIDHIRKELHEIEADPTDIREWVDVIILAFDGAWRAGWEPEAIIAAMVAKQTKNEGRTWPDWRTADPNKAIEHDRSRDHG